MQGPLGRLDNCFVGASFDAPARGAAAGADTGVDKIMWGSDYPHDEGTYPYSREGLRCAYAGVPREEVAAMVATPPGCTASTSTR